MSRRVDMFASEFFLVPVSFSCARNGNPSLIAALLKRGVSPNAKTRKGRPEINVDKGFLKLNKRACQLFHAQLGRLTPKKKHSRSSGL